jgi:hypothetical protein
MYNPPLGHLNYNNIVAEEQCGFRKNLTTEKATYELINEFVSALNDTLIVGGIMCELVKKKACDYVSYSLLSKLNFYGSTVKDYEWTKSYLWNRCQRLEKEIKILITRYFQTVEL